MADPLIIELNAVSMDGPVAVTFAEISPDYPPALARIRYKMDEREQDRGLRFDLDKQVFLDHLEDDRAERNLQKAAPHIARILEVSLSARLSEWLKDPDTQQNIDNWNDPDAEQSIPEQDERDNSAPQSNSARNARV